MRRPLPTGHTLGGMLKAILVISRAIAVAHDRWRTRVAPRRPMLVEISVLRERVECIREENDLLRARLRRVPSRQRPHYQRHERLAILAHAARYGLSVKATARALFVSVPSILRWRRDVEAGVDRVVQSRPPANKLPDLVAQLSRRLKHEWPRWGTRRIAGTLARLGLKASRTSVQAFLRRPYRPGDAARAPRPAHAALVAKHPNHLWFIDFTKVGGIFRSVVVGAVIDGYSRKVLALRVAPHEPSAAFAVRLVREAVRAVGAPTWLVSDHGTQFTAGEFRRALRSLDIGHRYGALHRTGSIARMERFWKSLKEEFVRGLALYRPLVSIERSLRYYAVWFDAERPHQGLDQRTPDEVFFGHSTRADCVPRDSVLAVQCVGGDHGLPLLRLRSAA